jgi:hypothetical protein
MGVALGSDVLLGLLLCARLQEPAPEAAQVGYRMIGELFGRPEDGEFGVSVAGGGDLDADGTPDLVVGSNNFSAKTKKGYVRAFSGKNGEMLFEGEDTTVGQGYGLFVCVVGDANLDGHADVLVGSPRTSFLPDQSERVPGQAVLHSGKDGARLATLTGKSTFGWAVAGVGDVNGDGYPDIAVGETRPGSINVFSGKDGALLLQRSNVAESYGGNVAPAGDADLDGFPDVLVGAHSADGPERDRGLVELLSGKDLGVLRTHQGGAEFDGLGSCVASLGDVDRDGHADYLVGARGVDGQVPDGKGAVTDDSHAGVLYVFSGKDGSELRRVHGPHAGAELGTYACGMGDLNGDAVPDFAATGSRRNDGWVGLFSGADGALLRHVPGQSVACTGDVDGDEHNDLVVGLYARPKAIGRALVIAGAGPP